MESMMPGSTPWRVLVLDRSDASDPRWLLATITLSSDVLPASLDRIGRYEDWPEVTQWVRERLGYDAQLNPMPHAMAWHVDGKR